MENIKNFSITDIPTWKIALVATSDHDYEMDRTMLVEDYPDYGDYTIVSGGHCSCYDFGETKWDATKYTSDELKKVAQTWRDNGYGSEMNIAPLILRYLR